MTAASTPNPSAVGAPQRGRPDHDRRRGRAYQPTFSVLRASVAQRLAIAAGLAAVLWAAVIWVTP